MANEWGIKKWGRLLRRFAQTHTRKAFTREIPDILKIIRIILKSAKSARVQVSTLDKLDREERI
jgi:hypothetical protein